MHQAIAEDDRHRPSTHVRHNVATALWKPHHTSPMAGDSSILHRQQDPGESQARPHVPEPRPGRPLQLQPPGGHLAQRHSMTSAGSLRLRLSGYFSRKHLIQKYTHPEAVTKQQLRDLWQLYKDMGFPEDRL